MPVSALECPNCGAPLTPDGTRCAYCQMPLAVTGVTGAPGATPPADLAPGDPDAAFAMEVADVFTIAKRGTVVTGRIASGSVRAGQALVVDGSGGSIATRCEAVEQFRKKVDVAVAGENVGLLLAGIDKGQVAPGDRLRHA